MMLFSEMTYDKTNRSRFGQSGFLGLKVMNLLNRTWAAGAKPMGAPGWPELALKVASTCQDGDSISITSDTPRKRGHQDQFADGGVEAIEAAIKRGVEVEGYTDGKQSNCVDGQLVSLSVNHGDVDVLVLLLKGIN